jgi:hypothetical protein
MKYTSYASTADDLAIMVKQLSADAERYAARRAAMHARLVETISADYPIAMIADALLDDGWHDDD